MKRVRVYDRTIRFYVSHYWVVAASISGLCAAPIAGITLTARGVSATVYSTIRGHSYGNHYTNHFSG